MSDVLADPVHEVEARPMPRPVTRACWAREMGYVEVTNLVTGEKVEITFRNLTDVWKEDMRQLRKKP